jgi:vitamin B12 transporter
MPKFSLQHHRFIFSLLLFFKPLNFFKMEKKRKVWAITLIVLWWLAPSKTTAQQDSTKFTLQEVIVSASRQDTKLEDTPRSVSVIGGNQIVGGSYNSVADLLAQQAGVYLIGANQVPGSNQSLFLRGANSNQVVVMIDGVRITDPSTPNNVIDLSELSLTNVDRIEIVSGAHSTMYGGSSVGGVVNIITKNRLQEGVHGTISAQGGTFGKSTSNYLQQVDFSYASKSGFYANYSQVDQRVNGFSAASDTAKNSKQKFEPDNFQKQDRTVKLGYQFGQLNAQVSYKRTDQVADIDNGAFTDKTNNKLFFDRDFYSYSLNYRLSSQLQIKAIGSWSSSQRVNQNDSSQLPSGRFDGNYFKGNYRGEIQTHEIQATHQNNLLKSVIGVGIYDEEMSFNTFFYSSAFGGFSSRVNYDSVNKKSLTKYVFGQTTFKSGSSPFGFTLGGRISNHSLFGTVGTYELNPFVAFKNSILFASISSAFNAPSLYQLFDPTVQLGYTFTRGTGDLQAENSISIELGWKKSFDKGNVTLSAFNNIINNSIEYFYLWNKNKPIPNLNFSDYRGDKYLNVAKQIVTGIELTGQYQITPKIFTKGNFTWLNGSLQFKPSDITSTQNLVQTQVYSTGSFVTESETINSLLRRPNFTGFMSITFQVLPKLSVSTNARLAASRFDSVYDPKLGPFGALGRTNVQNYQLFDFFFNWNINQNVTLVTRIENIFDSKYEEISGFTTRGRSLYLKCIVRW